MNDQLSDIDLDDAKRLLTTVKDQDVYSWKRQDWPSPTDENMTTLLRAIESWDRKERGELQNTIRTERLDQHLEMFAFRCSRHASNREELFPAFLALRLCESRESILLSRDVEREARRLKVSAKKLARAAAKIIG